MLFYPYTRDEEFKSQINEITEHKAVSQKAPFQFLIEDISFLTVALCGLPNITLQIPKKTVLPKGSSRESCNSGR